MWPLNYLIKCSVHSIWILQGDLKTYLRSHRVAVESFNEKGLLLKFAADIAAGLLAMHERNYTHRYELTKTLFNEENKYIYYKPYERCS